MVYRLLELDPAHPSDSIMPWMLPQTTPQPRGAEATQLFSCSAWWRALLPLTNCTWNLLSEAQWWILPPRIVWADPEPKRVTPKQPSQEIPMTWAISDFGDTQPWRSRNTNIRINYIHCWLHPILLSLISFMLVAEKKFMCDSCACTGHPLWTVLTNRSGDRNGHWLPTDRPWPPPTIKTHRISPSLPPNYHCHTSLRPCRLLQRCTNSGGHERGGASWIGVPQMVGLLV